MLRMSHGSERREKCADIFLVLKIHIQLCLYKLSPIKIMYDCIMQ